MDDNTIKELGSSKVQEKNMVVHLTDNARADTVIQANYYYESQRPADPDFPQFVGVPERDALFTGRDEQLRRLEQNISEDSSPITIQAVVGLGGIGKTSLVGEYCHQNRKNFDVIRWLPATNRLELETDFRWMASALGIDIAGLSTDDAIARVVAWLEEADERWLLVFDNVIQPHVLNGLTPKKGRGQVLVTTRHSDWPSRGCEVINLDVLDDESAVKLLTSHSGRAIDDHAQLVVERLGSLSLAIVQAGAFIRHTACSYDDYRTILDRRSEQLLGGNDADLVEQDRVDLTVLTVWDTSLEYASRDAEGARTVLNILSHFGPHDLPVSMLLEPYSDTEDVLGRGDEAFIRRAVGALGKYSLLTFRPANDPNIGPTASVHRLVQEVTRLRLRRTPAPDSWSNVALRIMSRAYPRRPQDPTQWPWVRSLSPHLLAVVENSTEDDSPEICAWLLDRYATYLQYSGNVTASPQMFEAALAIYDDYAPNEAYGALITRGNLAASYDANGRSLEAIEMEERVLNESERRLGPVHEDTIMARANLAVSYSHAGQGRSALLLMKRALNDARTHLGERSMHAARYMTGLAGMYLESGGDPVKIETLLTDALDILEHDDTAGHDQWHLKLNLAVSLVANGRVQDVASLLKHLISETTKTLGNDHPTTLIARLYKLWHIDHTSDPSTLADLRQLVASSEEVMGSSHPQTLLAKIALTDSLSGCERHFEALEIAEQSLVDAERDLGGTRPIVTALRLKVGVLYRKLARHNDALDTFETVASETDGAAGDGQLFSLRARSELAKLYSDLGRELEARQMMENAVYDLERLIGPLHRETLSWKVAFGVILCKNDNDKPALQRALRIFKAVQNDCEDRFGRTESTALTARAQIGRIQYLLGAPDEAVASLKSVLEDVVADRHPDNQVQFKVLGHLARAYREAGQPNRAANVAEAAVDWSERVNGRESRTTLEARCELLVLYVRSSDLPDARPYGQELLHDATRILGADDPLTLLVRGHLCNTYLIAGEYDGFVSRYRELVAARERSLGHHDDTTLESRGTFLMGLIAMSRWDDAIAELERIVAVDAERLGMEDPLTVSSLETLAKVLWKAGQRARAVDVQASMVDASRRSRRVAAEYVSGAEELMMSWIAGASEDFSFTVCTGRIDYLK